MIKTWGEIRTRFPTKRPIYILLTFMNAVNIRLSYLFNKYSLSLYYLQTPFYDKTKLKKILIFQGQKLLDSCKIIHNLFSRMLNASLKDMEKPKFSNSMKNWQTILKNESLLSENFFIITMNLFQFWN